MFVQDKEARELQAAQQEVMALRARVRQLESDTHSSSSLELKNLSLQQVCAVLNTAHMHSTSLEPSVLVTNERSTGLAKAPWVWQQSLFFFLMKRKVFRRFSRGKLTNTFLLENSPGIPFRVWQHTVCQDDVDMGNVHDHGGS